MNFKKEEKMDTGEPVAVEKSWDEYFQRLIDHGGDLNPHGWWMPELLPFLTEYKVIKGLDLGCGTGGDCRFLAERGYKTEGIDISSEAIDYAKKKAKEDRLKIKFRQADISKTLKYKKNKFDAVMSNVSLHAFSDKVTREIIDEIHRILKPGGLILLHLNSTEDKPFRERIYKRVREIEPNFYLEDSGRTIHFFSAEYCRDILSDWIMRDLTHNERRDPKGNVMKCVWRCVAQKRE
jgi:SAM-dependent methyltransferase